ncbi:hypothetical protein AKJ08_1222 [Vulgatibacter incomptus]|uniref:VanZ-like domain-containing protein n=1 Tax=Vulgatibacter incomptus TaxID=1391653 RepID=A0A0K1PBD4_9BACT|nr:hypothetical protein AKJ08_1222 [Vulgatibacter incomptus]
MFYAGLIFYFSAQTTLPKVGLLSMLKRAFEASLFSGWIGFDKLEHFTEYAGFGFLIARALRFVGPTSMSTLRGWGVTVALGAAFGVSDEIHQYFVPGRDSSIFDVAADTLGTAFGAMVWVVFARLTRPLMGRSAPGSGRAAI